MAHVLRRSLIIHWCSNFGSKLWIASTACGEVLARFRQAQRSVGAAANLVRVVVILAVVLPPTDRTTLKSPSTVERFEATTRALIRFGLLRRFGNALEHFNSSNHAALRMRRVLCVSKVVRRVERPCVERLRNKGF